MNTSNWLKFTCLDLLCVCVCVSMLWSLCMSRCKYTCCIGWLSPPLSTLFVEVIFLLNSAVTNMASPASQLAWGGVLCVYLPAVELQVGHFTHPALKWVLRLELWSSNLHVTFVNYWTISPDLTPLSGPFFCSFDICISTNSCVEILLLRGVGLWVVVGHKDGAPANTSSSYKSAESYLTYCACEVAVKTTLRKKRTLTQSWTWTSQSWKS